MKVIILDKFKNIIRFGDYKLQFDGIKKRLEFKKIGEGSAETVIAEFDQVYIRKNNLLCTIEQKSGNALIVVFPTKEKCDPIYNGIVKVKARHPQPQDLADINEEELFKDIFYIPLIKQVQLCVNGYDDLKTILLNFTNTLDSEERLLYMNIMTEAFLLPFLPLHEEECCASSENESIKENYIMRKRSHIRNKESVNDQILNKKGNSSFVEPSPENSSNDVKQCYEFIFVRFSGEYRCIKCWDQKKSTLFKATAHDDGSRTFNFDSVKDHVCEPIDYLPGNYRSSLIVKNHEFLQREVMGIMRPLLIIFDSDDRNAYYKFGLDRPHKQYFCYKCKIYGINLSARFIHHDGSNAIELGHSQHRCQTRKFTPEILNSTAFGPTFNDDEMETAGASFNETFNTSNRSSRKRSFNNVSYKESDDETESSSFVEPSPRNSSNDVLFDIVEDFHDGNLVKKLLVFTSTEKMHCYEYFYRYNCSTDYRCIKCLEQNYNSLIKATIYDDGSRTYNFDTVEDHVCQPISYAPENYRSSLIVKSPNFKFLQRKIRGMIKPLLIIFNSDDKNTCYKFRYEGARKQYVCSGCKDLHHFLLSARFIQHNQSNSIELGHSQHHRCQPKKFVPESL
uniref:Uncharacterized protein n=1 Tax=Panagrolaimus sp. ES5 TaxID=591445 RepID=A0AC34GQX0_9BILA